MSLQVNCVACDQLPGEIPLQNSVLSSKMFQEIAGLKVKQHYTICKACQLELRNCYNFRMRCQEIFHLYNSALNIDHTDPLTGSQEVVVFKREPIDMEEEIERGSDDEEQPLVEKKERQEARREFVRKRKFFTSAGSMPKKQRRQSNESNSEESLLVDSSLVSEDLISSLTSLENKGTEQNRGELANEIVKLFSTIKQQLSREIKREVSKLAPARPRSVKIVPELEHSKYNPQDSSTKISNIEEFEAFIAAISNDETRDKLAQRMRQLPDYTRCYNKIHGKMATMLEYLFEKSFIAESLKWGEMNGTSSGKICLINYRDFIDMAIKVASTEKDGEIVPPQTKEVKTSLQLFFKHRAKKYLRELAFESLNSMQFDESDELSL